MKYLVLVFGLVLCADAKANSGYSAVSYAAPTTHYAHMPTRREKRQAKNAARKAAKSCYGSTAYAAPASAGTVAYAAPVCVVEAPACAGTLSYTPAIQVVPVLRTPILPRRRTVAIIAAPVYCPTCHLGECDKH